MQTLEKLEKFAQQGRIAFREDAVAPVAILVAPGGSAEVSLYGANVLSYRPTGHSPVLWLADSYKVVEPGSPTRGGIPVCWPWFGRLENKDMPMHGFARTQFWSVIEAESDAETTSVTLALVENKSTLALWPHPFRLELKVTVGQSLALALTTVNTGSAPFAITEVPSVWSGFVLRGDGSRLLPPLRRGRDNRSRHRSPHSDREKGKRRERRVESEQRELQTHRRHEPGRLAQVRLRRDRQCRWRAAGNRARRHAHHFGHDLGYPYRRRWSPRWRDGESVGAIGRYSAVITARNLAGRPPLARMPWSFVASK